MPDAKRQFYWHGQSVLSGGGGGGGGRGRAQFAGEAVTVDPIPLQARDSSGGGGCGSAPYLLLSSDAQNTQREASQPVRGELFVVDDECLKNVDEFEGATISNEFRRTVAVRRDDDKAAAATVTQPRPVLRANVYVKYGRGQ